jgi:PTH2 family peptidyl-tRNA hydrolase
MDDNKTVLKVVLPYSLVVLIRSDLRMKPGKIASQVIHAALGACYQTLDREITVKFMKESLERRIICLKVEDEEKMLEIQEEMQKLKMNTFIQVDLGFTQVPSLSKTAMAIGPDYTDKFSGLFKNLALY